MANRYPLILDSSNNKIKELPSGDNLDLTGAGISSVSSVSVGTAVTIGTYGIHATGVITATSFVGDGSGITGVANTEFIVGTAATFTSELSVAGITTADATGVNVTGVVTATTFVGALTGNVTGDTSGSSGSCTGNAATATALASARNIGGVSFDGTADINLPGVNQSGTQNTSGTAGGLSGTPDIAIGDLTASGNVSIAGTLTYQDVTNMDVLGIGTFQQGIQILANGVDVTGFSTFKTGVSITGVCTATDFNSTSDTSVKENIQVIEDPLASIVRIDGVTFTWKDTGKNSAGVTAQNLEQVLPNLVSNGDLKSVNYNGLIGYLIEAVKSQQAQIDELKSRLDSLDS